MGELMDRCVIYARVSTKEQQDEGYSIPAQLKAIRAFCASQKLSPVAEFVEAESAGKAGRKRFTEMVEFLKTNADVRVVVAHKLDRLYRNFADQVLLEEIVGARARYVNGDVPDSPQGELLRDVQLSVAKFYLGNLAEEVRKGMDEKVLQGGWPHRAPLGYLNDRSTRTIVPDPLKAPLVRWAFERYASGVVSLSQIADELADRGLVQGSGRKLGAASVHHILSNPIYAGRIRHRTRSFRVRMNRSSRRRCSRRCRTHSRASATAPSRAGCSRCVASCTARNAAASSPQECTRGTSTTAARTGAVRAPTRSTRAKRCSRPR